MLNHNTPDVSVVIPTYNRAGMVGDAIQSVLDQTYTNWELIIIDDGSGDDTQQVVEKFADPRIRYIYQENKGLPGARNTGIRAARGQYVAFLDSDDLFLKRKLEWQVYELERRPELGLVAGGYIEVDAQLRVLRELQPWLEHPTLALKDWLLGCPFCPGVPLVRRVWLEQVDLFDERMSYIEDWDLWLRMSRAGCRMDWIESPVCFYRIHGSNMVRNALMMKQGMVTMLDKLYAQPNLPGEIIALRDTAYANTYLNAAARAYAASAPEEGQACLSKAISLDPALLEGNPPQALNSLASFALSSLTEDAAAFMDMLAEHIPEGLNSVHWSKRKGRGLLHAVAAFEYYRCGVYPAVVKHAVLALVYDPGWGRNRGLFSIMGRALLEQGKLLTHAG